MQVCMLGCMYVLYVWMHVCMSVCMHPVVEWRIPMIKCGMNSQHVSSIVYTLHVADVHPNIREFMPIQRPQSKPPNHSRVAGLTTRNGGNRYLRILHQGDMRKKHANICNKHTIFEHSNTEMDDCHGNIQQHPHPCTVEAFYGNPEALDQNLRPFFAWSSQHGTKALLPLRSRSPFPSLGSFHVFCKPFGNGERGWSKDRFSQV